MNRINHLLPAVLSLYTAILLLQPYMLLLNNSIHVFLIAFPFAEKITESSGRSGIIYVWLTVFQVTEH